jgi:DnaK suppressor protein
VKLDQSSVGRLSRMDALQAQAMHQEAARRREEQLCEIEITLAKIDSGDYGYCEECGDEIAEKRLLIKPTAVYCIACSNRMEQS